MLMQRKRDRHVLLTTDAVGGIWRYTLDLANGLSALGVRCTIVCLGPVDEVEAELDVAKIEKASLLCEPLPLDWLASDVSDVKSAAQRLADIARARGVDIVHLHSPAYAAFATFRVPVVVVNHSCVATWWQNVHGTELPHDLSWRAGLTRRGLLEADAVVTPTYAFALSTTRAYALPFLPHVIHNASTSVDEPIGYRPEAEVLTAGRLWDESKNVAALDRAAASIHAPVLAAGAMVGPHGARCHLQFVRPLGQLTDAGVRARYERRPVYVSTAIYEPFGLAILEAARFGCALVLADIPSLRELWQDAAIFVNPHDTTILAETINRLLDAPAQRHQLGQRAAVRSQYYNVPAMVTKVQSLHDAVLERSRARLTSCGAA
jgi:phosphatidylinositol alpha-mannosyltransferase